MENHKTESIIELTRASVNHISTIRKWAFFLSVLGFVMLGILVIFGFSLGFFIDKLGVDTGVPFPYFIIGFIYLIIGVIYFFPILYLYRFSIHAKKSLEDNDSNTLSIAFRFLRDTFIYIGILFAIATAIYLLSIIVFGIMWLIL